jgi:hypothetical protein
MGLIAGIAVLAEAATNMPAIDWAIVILPGCLLIPGAYLSVKLLRINGPAEINNIRVKPGLCGASGLLIGIVPFGALVHIQNGAGQR